MNRSFNNSVVLLLLSLSSEVRSFLRLFFPHFSLTNFSVNSHQLFLSFSAVLYSAPNLPNPAPTPNPLLRIPPIAFSSFLTFLFPPLSGDQIFLPFFHLSLLPHDRLISTYSSPIPSLSFLHSNLQSLITSSGDCIECPEI